MAGAKPRAARVERVVVENARVKTFMFDLELEAEPGQFVMLWLPGVDEKPFALSYMPKVGVSVARVGAFTRRLHEIHEGETLGIRGPYGRGFRLPGSDAAVCLVAGGVGAAALAPLAERLKASGAKITTVLGAGSASELLFEKRFSACGEVLVCTDDGSKGRKALAAALFSELLGSRDFDAVYACGPELMIYEVARLCEEHGIKMQAAVERYMRCGIGICGSCALNGHRVCVEGPVFDGRTLLRSEEFASVRRERSGRLTRVR